MFQHVAFYPGDPILSLVETFNNDPRTHKVNLSIGIYFDENGKLPVLDSVRQAEVKRAATALPRPYLPMEGLDAFRRGVQNLLFGATNPALQENRIATIQTLGGSGALKVGADFLRRWFPNAKVYVSNPTWDNHKGIFEGAGFEVGTYPYYAPATGCVQFEEMLAFLLHLPEHSILILHPCCHNPTGVDLTAAQWDAVLEIVQTRKLIPFMDIAYQGFGDDLDGDAYAIRKAVQMGLPLFVSNSFSKNMSLYGERVGGLSVVCPNEEEAALVFGQLKFTVRRIYSSPPAHGGYVAADVMNTPELLAQWQSEVYAMRDRIRAMRQKLYDVLTRKVPGKNFDYFITQRGMFSYTGLTPEQVQRLQDEFAVYLVGSGRMCVAGLNESNIDYVADAFAEVLK
ncbi:MULTISPECIES: amino acid aminotransferase [unclassified Neisseria]|uniref:amino acid aminotransferase n=1 Tax=unclassified Neisseria TaxID=2623750 RepID=UPI00266542DC|nr:MULTISPECIES: amino acid aminotransferase [unclassified Neisseria]MDO1510309.1 amino acid aminotransferase [Neisseria sp. MVDL19-042950]MDO1516478.1 amino acid aminotransferase [Neisseria sp. MVDL18-041461]MDO1563626.1 amino acid aminotransferase [Neisseria sp. MVDL20-010259]